MHFRVSIKCFAYVALQVRMLY